MISLATLTAIIAQVCFTLPTRLQKEACLEDATNCSIINAGEINPEFKSCIKKALHENR